MLIDIAAEELSHLEVIGTVIGMLNKGAKGRISEGTNSAAEVYREISGGGNDSHVTLVLYGGGPACTIPAVRRGRLRTVIPSATVPLTTLEHRSRGAGENCL
jgi:hypothetical protein